jgi:hypothetical protein
MSLNSRSTWQSGLHASVDAMAEAESGLAQIIVVGEEWTNAGPQNRVAAQPQCLRTANTTRTADALCRARMTPPTRGMLGQPPHRAYHLRLLCRSSSPQARQKFFFFLNFGASSSEVLTDMDAGLRARRATRHSEGAAEGSTHEIRCYRLPASLQG